MQNMHKTTHDGPLTGVHLPNHGSRGSGARMSMSTCAGSTDRGARRGTKAVVYITARGLGGVISAPGAGYQQNYGDGGEKSGVAPRKKPPENLSGNEKVETRK